MKRLYLLRHAKSSWEDQEVPDIGRSLSKRGRRAAPAIGRYAQSEGFRPQLVLCSSARRARETYDLAAAAWAPPPEIRFEPSLYLAEPETILRLLAALPEATDGVMVIGHNPGLQVLAVQLGGSGGEALQRLRSKFPTGGLAVFDLNIDRWHDIADASGSLVRFVAPHDLD